MPFAAPEIPRKILPPPITMQICVPARTAGSTSAAIRSTVPTSMPYDWSPINASPETFRSTRRYFGVAAMTVPLMTCHLFYFVGEVAVGLFHSLANLEANEAGDFHWRAEVLRRFLDHFVDARLAINDENLLQENGLFIKFSHAPFHHLLDDVVRLARLLCNFGLDGPLAIDHFLRKMRRS